MRKLFAWLKFILKGDEKTVDLEFKVDEKAVDHPLSSDYFLWPDGSISVPEKDGTKPPR